MSDTLYVLENLMNAIADVDGLSLPMKYLRLDPAASQVTFNDERYDEKQFAEDSAAYRRIASEHEGWDDAVYDLDGAVSVLSDYFSYAADPELYRSVSPEEYMTELNNIFRGFFGVDLPACELVRERRVVLDVPYISQENRLPNGCESVSATMLLQYCGFEIEPETFVDEYLEREPVTIKWGCRYGPNPKQRYAGDPYSTNEGYGCFAPVIVRALNKYLSGTEYTAKNVSGMSLSMLKEQYIDKGTPVAVWATVGMKEIDKIILWQSTDGKESFMYPANEHCMVFVGYDETEDKYIFADPYGSNGIVSYDVDGSVLAYNSLSAQAVVIVKRPTAG